MRSLWVGGHLAAPVSSTSSIGSVNGSASSKRNGRVVVRGLERRGVAERLLSGLVIPGAITCLSERSKFLRSKVM